MSFFPEERTGPCRERGGPASLTALCSSAQPGALCSGIWEVLDLPLPVTMPWKLLPGWLEGPLSPEWEGETTHTLGVQRWARVDSLSIESEEA